MSRMNPKARQACLLSLLLPFAALGQQAVAPPAETTQAPQPAGVAEPELPAIVRVNGVQTLGDYATVTRLLGAASGVRRVDVTEAEGSVVTFRVLVKGGSAALDQALGNGGQLVRSGESGGRLVYELRR
jgi:hypothetical protein